MEAKKIVDDTEIALFRQRHHHVVVIEADLCRLLRPGAVVKQQFEVGHDVVALAPDKFRGKIVAPHAHIPAKTQLVLKKVVERLGRALADMLEERTEKALDDALRGKRIERIERVVFAHRYDLAVDKLEHAASRFRRRYPQLAEQIVGSRPIERIARKPDSHAKLARLFGGIGKNITPFVRKNLRLGRHRNPTARPQMAVIYLGSGHAFAVQLLKLASDARFVERIAAPPPERHLAISARRLLKRFEKR